MAVKLNTLEEIKDLFAKYTPGMVVRITGPGGSIRATDNIPWDFTKFHYSLVKTLPSIDWNLVHEKFKYMATDSDGETFLYEELPVRDDIGWFVDSVGDVEIVEAHYFKSYKPGTVDWKDSLVKREQISGKRPHWFIFDDMT